MLACKIALQRRLNGHGPLVFNFRDGSRRGGGNSWLVGFAAWSEEPLDRVVDDRGDGLPDRLFIGSW